MPETNFNNLDHIDKLRYFCISNTMPILVDSFIEEFIQKFCKKLIQKVSGHLKLNDFGC